jgi:hypothetical protein
MKQEDGSENNWLDEGQDTLSVQPGINSTLCFPALVEFHELRPASSGILSQCPKPSQGEVSMDPAMMPPGGYWRKFYTMATQNWPLIRVSSTAKFVVQLGTKSQFS